MKGALLIFVVTLLLQIVTPIWWWIIVVPLVVCLFFDYRGFRAWSVGAAGVGCLWLFASVYFLFGDASIVAVRVAEMFSVNSGWLLVIMTTLVAILCGGFASLTGAMLRQVFTDYRRRHQLR